MADWYVSSAVYATLSVWTASHAYTVGNIIKPTAPATGREYTFRCTTAGTSGTTEPSWASAASDGSTITDGGVTWTNVTGRSAYGWSAPAGTLFCMTSTAFNSRSSGPGDRYFLSSDHSETGVGQTYALVGTNSYGLTQVISVNRSGSVPPVVADLQSGASMTVSSGSMFIDAMTNMLWHGLAFILTSAANIYFENSGSKLHYFKNSSLFLNSTNTSSNIGPYSSTAKVIFDNTTVQFGATGQHICSSSNALDLTWINTLNPLQGSIIPTAIFQALNNTNPMLITCLGVDFSAVTTTLVGVSTSYPSFTKALFESCKIASGVTRYQSGSQTPADEIELVNCFDGTNVINERYTPAGSIIVDRATYLTAGAQDDIGAYSIKLVSNANSDFQAFPLSAFTFDVENTVTGTSKTATVEVVSSGSLNSNDIRLLLEYMGGTYTTTWNPADIAGGSLSNGNLTFTNSGSWGGTRATLGLTSGKYYFEVAMTQWINSFSGPGLALASYNLGTTSVDTAGVAGLGHNGTIYVNGSSSGSSLTVAAGNIIGIAVDLTAQLIWFRVAPSGNWNGSGTANPATGTGGISISAISTAALFPIFITSGSPEAGIANFGASVFSGAVPSGFTSGWGTVSTATSIASFVDSLSSVLTPPLSLPSSSNTWTVPVSYTTWNPSDAVAIVLSNGNLTATNSSLVAGVRSITGVSSGKYYWECTMTSWPTSTGIGIASASANLSLIYSAAAQAALLYSSGSVWFNGSSASPNLGARANGDIIGIALDVTNALIWFRVAPSGNWNGSGTANPATGVGGLSVSTLTGNLFPVFGMNSSGPNTTANFGASAFTGTVPSGFAAGISAAPTTKQLLQVTFTPQRVGRVRGLVRLGKVSATVWVDPRITIS